MYSTDIIVRFQKDVTFHDRFTINYPNTKFNKNSCSWSRAVECGQTDRYGKVGSKFSKFRERAQKFYCAYRLFLRTGCSFVPAVPTYRLFLPTGCSYVPAVPSYRLFLLTGFSFLPAFPTYRLFLRTGCSYVPAVPTYRLFLCTDCFYVSTNQQHRLPLT